jgi:ubiquitin-protein ligase
MKIHIHSYQIIPNWNRKNYTKGIVFFFLLSNDHPMAISGKFHDGIFSSNIFNKTVQNCLSRICFRYYENNLVRNVVNQIVSLININNKNSRSNSGKYTIYQRQQENIKSVIKLQTFGDLKRFIQELSFHVVRVEKKLDFCTLFKTSWGRYFHLVVEIGKQETLSKISLYSINK